MPAQPETAGSAENDLIESMLHRQEEVLTELDDLFSRIDAVISELTEQRKREAEESENLLPFGSLPVEPKTGSEIDRQGPREKAA